MTLKTEPSDSTACLAQGGSPSPSSGWLQPPPAPHKGSWSPLSPGREAASRKKHVWLQNNGKNRGKQLDQGGTGVPPRVTRTLWEPLRLRDKNLKPKCCESPLSILVLLISPLLSTLPRLLAAKQTNKQTNKPPQSPKDYFMSQGLASGSRIWRNYSLIPYMCPARSCLQTVYRAAKLEPGEAGGPGLGLVPI